MILAKRQNDNDARLPALCTWKEQFHFQRAGWFWVKQNVRHPKQRLYEAKWEIALFHWILMAQSKATLLSREFRLSNVSGQWQQGKEAEVLTQKVKKVCSAKPQKWMPSVLRPVIIPSFINITQEQKFSIHSLYCGYEQNQNSVYTVYTVDMNKDTTQCGSPFSVCPSNNHNTNTKPFIWYSNGKCHC